MILQKDLARQRIAQTVHRMRSMVYPQTAAVDRLELAGPVGRLAWTQAQELVYQPAELGAAFGPAWSTWWCRAAATVPPEWSGSRVDLLWLSDTEATVWVGGQPVAGLMAMSKGGLPTREVVLVESAEGGDKLHFEVEVACNVFPRYEGLADAALTGVDFVLGVHDTPADTAPGLHVPPYTASLKRCSLARFDAEAWDLALDFAVLAELEAEHERSLDPAWAGELLRELDRCCNVWRADDRATWTQSAAILQPLLQTRNGGSTHNVTAVGHAHLDTAWLWPMAEAQRKFVRGVTSQLALMERYPEYRFACSSALHYRWLKETHPEVYERLKARVAEGRWLVVGGSWVEPDCNLPAGESLVRHLVHGQRFFEEEFGIRCSEFWNPDAFGFNAQMPQLLAGAGMSRFVAQKLSWNSFTKPAHDTFLWEGLDGTRVLTHFLPLAQYSALATVRELRENVERYQEHDVVARSLLLFGYGDGGAGPTAEMVERLRRARDLQGLPRTVTSSPAEFFQECSSADALPVVVGELYLERHRGTYTSQARLKRLNRGAEELLHDVEFIGVVAHTAGACDYPSAALDRLWRDLLVHQFHDVLPGSSIRIVNEEAEGALSDLVVSGDDLRRQLLTALATQERSMPVNTVGFPRREIGATPDGELALLECAAFGTGSIGETSDAVVVDELEDCVVIQNARLRATLRRDGLLRSLVDLETGRESLSARGNKLELWTDRPVAWDAWEVDPAHLEIAPAVASGRLVRISHDPLRVDLEYEYALGESSSLSQRIRLDAESRRLEFHTTVDWHESHKLLKVCFPVAVRASRAVYQMQFGVCERPTHRSTPAAAAQFEVPGHRFVDLGDYAFGVALLSDCKYGYSANENELRISLLRASRRPDQEADIGRHEFAYAVVPHRGRWQDAGIVAESVVFNRPLLWAGLASAGAFVETDDSNLVVDTIKLADDGAGIIIRLFETHGASGTARVKPIFPAVAAQKCNLLEEPGADLSVAEAGIELPYRPFEVITIRVADQPKAIWDEGRTHAGADI